MPTDETKEEYEVFLEELEKLGWKPGCAECPLCKNCNTNHRKIRDNGTSEAECAGCGEWFSYQSVSFYKTEILPDGDQRKKAFWKKYGRTGLKNAVLK